MGLSDWVRRCAGKRILVLGDLCLDEYLVGRAQRLSREAPVPVLEFEERFTVPGAAGNPARNIQAAGGCALVAGVVGDDAPGEALLAALRQDGIDVSGIVVEPGRVTTVKTRVLANHLFPQQLARIDRQERGPLQGRTRRALRQVLEELAPEADAVLVSDYRSGVVDAPLVAAALELGGSDRLVTVDSQGDFGKFKGVSLLRCNREEAEGFLHRRLGSERALEQAGAALRQRLGVRSVVITRGSEGMSMIDPEGEAHHIPASNPSEVYDVTGAGDTVIAILTLALSGGAPLVEAARLANYAAGHVVRKLGNATVSGEELAALAEPPGTQGPG